jgi:hypothetical protein
LSENTAHHIQNPTIRFETIKEFSFTSNFYRAKKISDISIIGKKLTLSVAKNLIDIGYSELSRPLKIDDRKYTHPLALKIDTPLSSKEYFNILVSASYELTRGEYKDENAMVLYRAGMYGQLCDYPLAIIERAFLKHIKESSQRATPHDIIRQIEGDEGTWCSRQLKQINSITGLLPTINFNLCHLKKLIEKEGG